uniref:(northern house mosquito) hypothetical protein n=1 Tax=Culex pipiens TaxID=7175 RepID=A0A8D8I629_CULPI
MLQQFFLLFLCIVGQNHIQMAHRRFWLDFHRRALLDRLLQLKHLGGDQQVLLNHHRLLRDFLLHFNLLGAIPDRLTARTVVKAGVLKGGFNLSDRVANRRQVGRYHRGRFVRLVKIVGRSSVLRSFAQFLLLLPQRILENVARRFRLLSAALPHRRFIDVNVHDGRTRLAKVLAARL